MTFKAKILSGWIVAAAMLATSASAQDVKHYRFAHDQQLNSGYSVAYDIFSAKLKELSKGTMLVDQYPGAQLGQEPQILQLVRSGDIDFAIVSSANTSTTGPVRSSRSASITQSVAFGIGSPASIHTGDAASGSGE